MPHKESDPPSKWSYLGTMGSLAAQTQAQLLQHWATAMGPYGAGNPEPPTIVGGTGGSSAPGGSLTICGGAGGGGSVISGGAGGGGTGYTITLTASPPPDLTASVGSLALSNDTVITTEKEAACPLQYEQTIRIDERGIMAEKLVAQCRKLAKKTEYEAENKFCYESYDAGFAWGIAEGYRRAASNIIKACKASKKVPTSILELHPKRPPPGYEFCLSVDHKGGMQHTSSVVRQASKALTVKEAHEKYTEESRPACMALVKQWLVWVNSPAAQKEWNSVFLLKEKLAQKEKPGASKEQLFSDWTHLQLLLAASGNRSFP